MYTITLADGRKLKNLEMNGNNFISKTRVDESIFNNNLSTLTYTDGETETVLHDAELIQQVEYEDGWHFCFREITPQEKAFTALNAAVATNSDSVTDMQLALAEVYEMILGGM